MNKRVIFFFAAFLFFATLQAQKHEIGIQAGGSNLSADIGMAEYINPVPQHRRTLATDNIPLYVALSYKYSFNPFQGIKFRAGYNYVAFNDRFSDENFRNKRGDSGENEAYELSAVFEYNFYPINEEQPELMWSPYIFGGIGGLLHSSKRISIATDFNRDTDGLALAPTSPTDFQTEITYGMAHDKLTVAIPFGLGLKAKFNYRWSVFAEAQFRPTFSDQLDYSTITEEDVKITYNKDLKSEENSKSLLQTDPYQSEIYKIRDAEIAENQFGNTNSKDWLNSFSIGVSYAFGRCPCGK